MNHLKKTFGQQRVVIDAIRPQLDGGRNPLKRVLGDWIHFEVDAFADSHDKIRLALKVRKVGTADWETLPLTLKENDTYTTTYKSSDIGLFEYQVVGGIDHYKSWLEGIKKKAAEGQDLSVEFKIGSQLLQAFAHPLQTVAPTMDTERTVALLKEHIGILENGTIASDERLRVASNSELQSITGNLDLFEVKTASELSLLLIERELAVFSTWYEFFPRSCVNDGKTHGTFKDAAQRLHSISEMGFDVVYFPPISPIGRKFRKGKNNTLEADANDVGSPWAIGASEGGHTSILPALGTLADFKSFLAEAEMRGMEVALDIAFQCAPDHPWVEAHPDWFRWRPDGTVQYAENPPKKYQDILPINFETEDWKALWDELKSVFKYWIRQGVKIFRIDNPHTKSLEFWRWCILNIKKDHPEVIFLAEAFTRPKRKYFLAKAGFTQGYTYFTWRNSAAELRQYVEELTQSETRDYFWPNFWPNTPDILHAELQSGNRSAFIGRYLLAATLSSNMGIYGPAYELLDSEPFPGKEENNNSEKYELKVWDFERPDNIRSEISRINSLRNAHEAFQRTQNIEFLNCSNPNILVYLKQNFEKTDRFVVVVNMDWNERQTGTIVLDDPNLDLLTYGPVTVADRLSLDEASYEWTGPEAYVDLDPKKQVAHIFQIL